MTNGNSTALVTPGEDAPSATGSRYAPGVQQQQSMSWLLRVPLSVAIYGAPKLGKTTDILFAFPERALWFADVQALWPSMGTVGWAPNQQDVVQATTLQGALERLAAIRKSGGAGKYKAIIFDDTSLMATATIQALQKATNNKYEAWSRLDSIFGELISEARLMNAHIIFSGHEVPADPEKSRTMGTFQLPSYQLAMRLPAICSLVARVVRDPVRMAPSAAYAGPSDPSSRGWVVGDRLGVLSGPSLPVNLAELLRSRGHDIRRPDIWHDAIETAVQAACTYVAQGSNAQEVGAYYVNRGASEGWTEFMARWFLRDFRDRRLIANQPSALQGMLAGLY